MSGFINLDDDSCQPEWEPREHAPLGLYRMQNDAARGSMFASQGSELLAEMMASGRLSPRVYGRMASRRDSFYTLKDEDAQESPVHYRTLASADVTLPDYPTSLTDGSSGRTGPYAIDDSTIFEIPMLQRNPDRDANGGNNNGTVATARLYAGTSSGLKISVRWILAGVLVGMVVGILLAHFRVSSVVAQWVSLPGDLFLRAVRCLVTPYVFCSVAVAVGDIVFVGKVSIVGVQTAKIFVIQWVTSVALGLGVALLFRPLFRLENVAAALPRNTMQLLCSGSHPMSVASNGSVVCLTNTSATAFQPEPFSVFDANQVFRAKAKSVVAELTLTDELILTITPLVSSNVIASLANGQLLSITTFAMALGAIAGRNYFMKTRETNYLYLVLLQLRNMIFLLMEWTIWLSPFAVVSMIAGSFAANEASLRQFQVAYVYVLAAFIVTVVQMFLLLPGIVYFMTGCNPFVEMRKLARAYMFAFACSSSLATAPVTLTCVRKGDICSQSIANFVISIGVTSNLSGIGFYMPIACIFMAESSGNGDQLTALRIVGMFALSVLSCAGTPPIPAAGLVIITTIYSTIFGVSTMPATFAYVVAMDFVIDRFVTVCDVNDDVMALKVVAETTDETVTQEVLGEREQRPSKCSSMN